MPLICPPASGSFPILYSYLLCIPILRAGASADADLTSAATRCTTADDELSKAVQPPRIAGVTEVTMACTGRGSHLTLRLVGANTKSRWLMLTEVAIFADESSTDDPPLLSTTEPVIGPVLSTSTDGLSSSPPPPPAPVAPHRPSPTFNLPPPHYPSSVLKAAHEAAVHDAAAVSAGESASASASTSQVAATQLVQGAADTPMTASEAVGGATAITHAKTETITQKMVVVLCIMSFLCGLATAVGCGFCFILCGNNLLVDLEPSHFTLTLTLTLTLSPLTLHPLAPHPPPFTPPRTSPPAPHPQVHPGGADGGRSGPRAQRAGGRAPCPASEGARPPRPSPGEYIYIYICIYICICICIYIYIYMQVRDLRGLLLASASVQSLLAGSEEELGLIEEAMGAMGEEEAASHLEGLVREREEQKARQREEGTPLAQSEMCEVNQRMASAHTCIHTYIHTYMHACMHACIHTYLLCTAPT